MLTNDKINLLIEKYFRDHLGYTGFTAGDLVSGREYFNRVVEICQEYNEGFPNFDLLLSSNMDRLQPEKFFFALCDESFRLYTQPSPLKIKIATFNEESMRLFYSENINSFVSNTPLDRMHDSINNLSVVEKFKQNYLGQHEWLTDVDLIQMADACGIDNAIITPCNFSREAEAINNLGVAFHFKREDFMKKPVGNEICIPLLLEVGSSLSSSGFHGFFYNQGSHWVSAKATVNLQTKEIDVIYMNSMSAGDPRYIQYIFENALHFTKTELDAKGQPIQFTAFPGFKVNVQVKNDCLQQHNGWSCGYFAFKNLIDQMPESINKNFNKVSECNPHADRFRHPYSNQLRECFYKILTKGVKPNPIVQPKYPTYSSSYYSYPAANAGYYNYYNHANNPYTKNYETKPETSSDFMKQSKPTTNKYLLSQVKKPEDGAREQAWLEIRKMALDELNNYARDNNKPNSQACSRLISQIYQIPSTYSAASKVERLIDCLNDQRPENPSTAKKFFGKLKGRNHNTIWQVPGDNYFEVINSIKSQIVRADNQKTVQFVK